MLNFLSETFLLGLKNLRLHKLRSLLTALGIIIGVAAVIIMVAIGEGAKQTALEQIQAQSVFRSHPTRWPRSIARSASWAKPFRTNRGALMEEGPQARPSTWKN